jgi:hypothetical protein
MIQRLLDAKAVVDPPCNESVLQRSCKKLKPDAVKMLLDAKAPVDCPWFNSERDRDHVNHQRCRSSVVGIDQARDDWSSLQHVIHMKTRIDERDDKIAVIKVLLAAGARTYEYGKPTALQQCITGCSDIPIQVIKVLLEYHPELLDIPDGDGKRPLVTALTSHKKDVSIVKCLLDANAIPAHSHQDTDPMIFQLFNNTGISPNACDSATPQRARDILYLLLEYGASVTECNNDGVSLVMYMLNRVDGTYDLGDYAISVLVANVLDFILYGRMPTPENKQL